MATVNVVTPDNLGNEFDTAAPDITLKIGPTLSKAADGTIDVVGGVNTDTADKSFIAKYSLVGQNGNAFNTIASLATVDREDSVFSAGVYTPDGTENYVEISAMASYDNDTGVTNQGGEARVAPKLDLLKNGALVANSASAYQRHATGHNDSSNTVYWIDESPASGDTYAIRYNRGSTQPDVMLITQGHFTIKAVETLTVMVP